MLVVGPRGHAPRPASPARRTDAGDDRPPQPVHDEAGVTDEDVIDRERSRPTLSGSTSIWIDRLAGRVDEAHGCSLTVSLGAELGADRQHHVGRADDARWRSATPNGPMTPTASGSVSGKTPLPLAVVATGASSARASAGQAGLGLGQAHAVAGHDHGAAAPCGRLGGAASSASWSMARDRPGQVRARRVDARHRCRADPPFERAAVVDDRRPGPAAR